MNNLQVPLHTQANFSGKKPSSRDASADSSGNNKKEGFRVLPNSLTNDRSRQSFQAPTSSSVLFPLVARKADPQSGHLY